MAATVTNNPWSSKSWALDSEQHEDELMEQHRQEIQKKTSDFPSLSAAVPASDFPSLSAAATGKTKKKKPVPMTLVDFHKPTPAVQPKGLTAEDLMNLPTGPRERTAEELDRSKLGGGFRSYGGGRYGDESATSRWGSGRGSGSDEPRRGGFGRDSELVPSRADEVDDWGSAKKPLSSYGSDRRDRGDRGGFFGSESKADESDSWVSKKSFVPSEGRRFEGGRERRVIETSGGADAADNWSRKKEEDHRKFGSNGGSFDSLRERRGGGFDSNSNGGADSEAWGRRREEANGSGGGARPRLNLQPRTLPRPGTPPTLPRPGTPPAASEGQQNDTVAPAKPKSSSNPFGAARPREEVLKEKGQDWKEIDEKIELMKLKEKEEALKEGSSFGRGFGSGNGRKTPEGPPPERSWRRPGQEDVRPSSAESTEKVETGVANDTGDAQE